MATECGIAIKTNEGYKTIYCHNDGYDSYMWPMLTQNYNSAKRASDLVELGDASVIDRQMVPSSYSGHSFDSPENGVCIFYHRDRGEDWSHTHPTMYTKDELLSEYYYVYIWEDDKWTAYKNKRVNYVESLL